MNDLLDRTKEGNVEEPKDDMSNEYLQSFKVASYVVKDEEEEEEVRRGTFSRKF